MKYWFISSFPSIGVTEATFPPCCCICVCVCGWVLIWFFPINFCISFKSTPAGIVVFDLAKVVGIWKYLFKSSPSSGSFTWIWLLICWTGCWIIFCWIFIFLLLLKGVCTICLVFNTWEIILVGAALCCEVKVAKSTGPELDIFDCFIWFWFISLMSSISLSFFVSLGWLYWSTISCKLFWVSLIWFWLLYKANSSTSFCICWFWISYWGVWILFCSSSSICLYWTGLDAFIATSYAPSILGEPSCSYNFWLDISCSSWFMLALWTNSVSWG